MYSVQHHDTEPVNPFQQSRCPPLEVTFCEQVTVPKQTSDDGRVIIEISFCIFEPSWSLEHILGRSQADHPWIHPLQWMDPVTEVFCHSLSIFLKILQHAYTLLVLMEFPPV